MVSASLISFLAGVAAIVFLWLHAPVHISKTTAATEDVEQQRGVQLCQINSYADGENDEDEDIDIIAVHGLDTRSPETWEYKLADGHTVNWLQDKHMLPAEVSKARIFTCNWPAELLQRLDADQDTIQELALLLLAGIQGRDSSMDDRTRRKNRPIVFIASCLGGIILMNALVIANGEYLPVRNATRGIVFLATPFRGTSFQAVARWAEPGLRAWASIQSRQVTNLLEWVKSPTFDLVRLVSQFTQLCDGKNTAGFKVLTFYETRFTNLPAKIPLLSFLLSPSKKQLVDKSSAVLDCVPNPLRLDRTHVLMNKFRGPKDSDSDYKLVVNKIQDLLEEVRKGTPLEKADAWIREKHYTQERLKIERLSGDPLPMRQCYINLALVEKQQNHSSKQTSKDGLTQPSPFSLASRLKVETLHESLQVELSNLFEPRKQPDSHDKRPRRILIRGRAGVGKTTLCKKIVHDFIEKRMWQAVFARILWVPLRNLKTWSGPRYNLEEMIRHIYLQECPEDAFLSRALRQDVDNSTSRATLFILDGLDEVSELLDWQRNASMNDFLEGLLNNANVIITTRPHVTLPHRFRRPDLELETVGFRPEQVQKYLKAVITMPSAFENIRSFLRKSPLMESLVRIPVQLDALCAVWDDTFEDDHGLETMTQVYQAITERLWRKDIKRLKESKPHVEALSSSEVDSYAKEEIIILEFLAFSGMCSNLIDFHSAHRNAVHEYVRPKGTDLPVYEILGRLSFLRTSDLLADLSARSHHFIHLTFQEYFAAKYFAGRWKNKEKLRYVDFNHRKKKICEISPEGFLAKNKYTGRYNIMWRFVAGLLDDNGEDEVSRFFTEIETGPFDLLGPIHQRLVMHCLSETVDLPIDMRTQREERLLQWMLFERDLTGLSTFARESEIPDEVLCNALSAPGNKTVLVHALTYSQKHFSPKMTVALVELLKASSSRMRHYAAEALCNQPILLEAVVDALLKNKDMFILDTAAETLGDQPILTQATIATLIKLLKHENSSSRSFAAQALGNQSAQSEATIVALTDLFNDEDCVVRCSAASAVGEQSTLPDASMAALLKLFDDEDDSVRYSAAMALHNQSTLSDATVAALLKLSKHKNSKTRSFAAQALINQSVHSEAIIVTLLELFDDELSSVRASAAQALGNHSKKSEVAMAAVVELLEHESSSVRHSALKALGTESSLSEKAVAAVVDLLKDKDTRIQIRAQRVLRRQSKLSEATKATIIELFKHEDSRIRGFAAQALTHQSVLSEGTITALIELCKEEYDSVRVSAADTLSNQLMLSETIMTAVIELLKHEDSYVRRSAAKALSKQSMQSEATMAALIKLFKEDSDVRHLAAAALGNQSKLSDVTVTAVIELLKNEDSDIRRDAAETLGKRSMLMDKMLDAAGILAPPNSQNGVDVCSDHGWHNVELFYESFLRRSFSEHFGLYADGNVCIIDRALDIKMVTLRDKARFHTAVKRGRSSLEKTYPYNLWTVFDKQDTG